MFFMLYSGEMCKKGDISVHGEGIIMSPDESRGHTGYICRAAVTSLGIVYQYFNID